MSELFYVFLSAHLHLKMNTEQFVQKIPGCYNVHVQIDN